jgi:hypothetical protein
MVSFDNLMGNPGELRDRNDGRRRNAHFGAAAVSTSAFLGHLGGAQIGVSMKRQKKHRQQGQERGETSQITYFGQPPELSHA